MKGQVFNSSKWRDVCLKTLEVRSLQSLKNFANFMSANTSDTCEAITKVRAVDVSFLHSYTF